MVELLSQLWCRMLHRKGVHRFGDRDVGICPTCACISLLDRRKGPPKRLDGEHQIRIPKRRRGEAPHIGI